MVRVDDINDDHAISRVRGSFRGPHWRVVPSAMLAHVDDIDDDHATRGDMLPHPHCPAVSLNVLYLCTLALSAMSSCFPVCCVVSLYLWWNGGMASIWVRWGGRHNCRAWITIRHVVE